MKFYFDCIMRPFKDKALAALVRVSKGEWGPGEPRLMADYLASLGKITQQALDSGANAFACKPLRLKELLQTMKELVPT